MRMTAPEVTATWSISTPTPKRSGPMEPVPNPNWKTAATFPRERREGHPNQTTKLPGNHAQNLNTPVVRRENGPRTGGFEPGTKGVNKSTQCTQKENYSERVFKHNRPNEYVPQKEKGHQRDGPVLIKLPLRLQRVVIQKRISQARLSAQKSMKLLSSPPNGCWPATSSNSSVSRFQTTCPMIFQPERPVRAT